MQKSKFWDEFGRIMFFKENGQRDYYKEHLYHNTICPERFKQQSAYASGPEEISELKRHK